MGELIGPEKLKELREARRAAIERGKTRHPSNHGRGLEGLLADVQGFSLQEREQVKDLFGGETRNDRDG